MAEYNWLLKFCPIEIFSGHVVPCDWIKNFTSLQMPPQDLFTYTKFLVYLVGKSWNLIFMLFHVHDFVWFLHTWFLHVRFFLLAFTCMIIISSWELFFVPSCAWFCMTFSCIICCLLLLVEHDFMWGDPFWWPDPKKNFLRIWEDFLETYPWSVGEGRS